VGLALARVAVGLLLLVGVFLVLRPFLVPAAWAATLGFVTWGPYARVRAATGRPNLTALLFTLAALLLLGIPIVWLLVLLIEQAIALLHAGQEWVAGGAVLPAWLLDLRWVGPRLQQILHQGTSSTGELAPQVGHIARALSQQVLSIAGGVAQNVFAFLITVITLYVVYAEGESLVARARRLLVYVFPSRPPEFLDQVGAVVRGVVIGIVGTALVQGALAGLGYGLFGLPYPAALGGLTTVFSFLPGGPALVWIPGAIWLAARGETGAAVGVVLWGALLVGSLDNVLRPILIRRSGGADMPFVIVLFGALGGLSAFGLLGLLIGPVLLSVAFALVSELPPAAEPAAEGGPPVPG
jgi:predicted PurR-regulated permease PerM